MLFLNYLYADNQYYDQSTVKSECYNCQMEVSDTLSQDSKVLHISQVSHPVYLCMCIFFFFFFKLLYMLLFDFILDFFPPYILSVNLFVCLFGSFWLARHVCVKIGRKTQLLLRLNCVKLKQNIKLLSACQNLLYETLSNKMFPPSLYFYAPLV